MSVKAKPENMDGDSYLAWLWKVEMAIRLRVNDIRTADRDWAVAAFNCNYDPKAAAYEWLRSVGSKP